MPGRSTRSLQGGDILAILPTAICQAGSAQQIDAVADAYVKAMEEAVKARAVQKTPERLAEEIHGCYPFHPRFADLVATFRNNEVRRSGGCSASPEDRARRLAAPDQ